MTIGIYALKFTGTEKVYIGQSVNIELRYKAHLHNLKNKTAAKKLQEAYSLYGTPDLDILVDNCKIQELNKLENEAIEIFDSFNNGFNSLEFSDSTPCLKGTEHSNSKYSEEKILEVVSLMLDINLTYKDISRITQVHTSLISKIATGVSHTWLSEKYPEIWKQLLNTKMNRVKVTNQVKVSGLSNHAAISNCAKSKGIIYPTLISPKGEYFASIDNAAEFARKYGLDRGNLNALLKGRIKSHKGWKVCPDEQV